MAYGFDSLLLINIKKKKKIYNHFNYTLNAKHILKLFSSCAFHGRPSVCRTLSIAKCASLLRIPQTVYGQKKQLTTNNFISTGKTEYARDLGNKLLVYVSCCFAGRAYPSGDIDETSVDSVRNQVFQCLCNQHTINADDKEDIYPYLRYSTREFTRYTPRYRPP